MGFGKTLGEWATCIWLRVTSHSVVMPLEGGLNDRQRLCQHAVAVRVLVAPFGLVPTPRLYLLVVNQGVVSIRARTDCQSVIHWGSDYL